MTEPADILIPIPSASVATHRKPRVVSVEIANGETLVGKSLTFRWQTVPVRDESGVGVRVPGEPERAPHLDSAVAFDPQNADHVAVVTAMDRIAKAEYARLTAPEVTP